MKEFNNYTCRTHSVLSKQLQMLWRTAMVVVAVFLLSPGALAQGDAPNLPDPDKCVAQDLLATEARLTGDSPCYTCEEGNKMLSTLELTINNKTGSVRTSVAFWATLVITDSDGNVTESYINGCTGPLSGKEYETFGFGDVSYECGDALVLKNIYLAWTDASDGDRNQCPLDPSKIAPKCKAQGDLVIIPPLSARVEAVVQPCVGETNGSITVFAQGGTGENYTYTLNPGNITNSTGVFTNLGEGTYTIKVEDSEKCSTEIEYVLQDQVCCVPPTVTAQPDDESVCEGEAASFTVAYTGGEPAPTIQWQVSTDGTTWEDITDGGAYNGATTATLSISATTEAMNGNWYRAALTSGTCETVYTEPAELEVNEIPDAPVSGGDQEVCATDPIQTLTATATAPEGITVVWYDAATGGNIVASPTLNTVGSVTYYAQAESEAGCISATRTAVTLIINETPAVPVVKNDEFCATTGTITLADYIEADGDVIFTNSEGVKLEVQPTTLSRATAGVFTYYVVQVEGDCVSEMASFTITINENPVSPTVTVTHPTCATTGSITVTAPLGDDLEYSINDGDDWQAEVLFADLAPGTYTVWVRNAAGCMAESNEVTINPVPDAPAAPVVHVKQPTCTDATATITITSSTEGLMFSVNGEPFVAYPAGGWVVTTAGEYSIVARNAAMCVSGATKVKVNLQPATPAAPTVTVVHPTCEEATGSITVTAPTGEGYEYSINDGDTWQAGTVFAGLVPGVYTVWVMNADGCMTESEEIRINAQPATPAAPTLTVMQPTCEKGGTITVTAPTGAGLEYSINDGETWQSGLIFTNVGAGTHTVWVRNAAGCMAESNEVTINPVPDAPAAPVVEVRQPTCTDATATITITSSTEGLMFSVNEGEFVAYPAGGWVVTTAGEYSIVARNAAMCVSGATRVRVNSQPFVPDAPVSGGNQVACVTDKMPLLTATATVPEGIRITWYTAAVGGSLVTSPTLNRVGTVTYYAEANYGKGEPDAGCPSRTRTAVTLTILERPAAPTARATHPSCTMATGTITVTAPLGEGMMYSLNGGTYQASVTFSGLASGNYTLTARSAAGCISGSTAVTINNAPSAPAAPTATVTQPTCLMPMGMITVTAPTGEGMMYSLNGGAYQSSTSFGDLMPGTYTLTVRNTAGCVSAGTTVVVNDQPNAPTPVVRCETSGFSYEDHKKGLVTVMHTSYGPVGVTARKRNPDGTYAMGNYAALFDTQAPTGDDTDLYTTDWGLAMIINQDQTNVPNDNQWGGEMIFNFAAIGPVTMQSLKALDIDNYENMSWIYLYDEAGNELYKVQLQNLGNNSKQMVDLGNTSGVITMKVVLDGRNESGHLAGSGAIDDIEFCVEETGSNCETVGFPYANHDAGLITLFHTPFGDVNVTGRKRNADGSFAAGNYAALFDTQAPTGDDTDLYTTDWGLALIINQDQTNVPNDNQHGGELMIDFSNIGPVTMESLKALDIDIYSNNAWVYLYDAEGNELYKVKLQNLGDNTKQDVDLGSTKGVMRMKVVFDGRDALGNLTGSGAIDEIRFCVESPCVDVAMDDDDSNKVEAVSIMDAKAYPTPFNDKTTIEFRTRNTEDYVVNLYDTRGSLIKQLKTGTAIAGELNKVEVEGRELAEGMYMARIVSGSGAKTVKLILKK